MTPEERALLRQDELEILEQASNTRFGLYAMHVPLLLSRLAAARAGEREMLEKACKAVCLECKAETPMAKFFLHKGRFGGFCGCTAVAIRKLMAELFPVAESETKEKSMAMVESGWLLEGGFAKDGGGVRYIGVINGMLGWTTDSLKALRLARREDADALAELVDDCEKVCEHQWG